MNTPRKLVLTGYIVLGMALFLTSFGRIRPPCPMNASVLCEPAMYVLALAIIYAFLGIPTLFLYLIWSDRAKDKQS